jgi:hypothetical protein
MLLVRQGADTRFQQRLHRRFEAVLQCRCIPRAPSFLLDNGDLFPGREHLPRIRELLTVAMQGRRA